MLRSAKIFMKDYGHLCRQSKSFYKEHWKGVVVLNVTLGAIGLAAMFVPSKARDILEKRREETEEASKENEQLKQKES